VAEVERRLLTKGAELLTVHADGPYVTLVGDSSRITLTHKQAQVRLIMDWGFTAEDAALTVKQAGTHQHQYYVKRAGPTSELFGQSYGDYDPSYNAMVNETQVDQVDAEMPKGDPSKYDPMQDQDLNRTLRAASKGQKDVFDVAVLEGLVKSVRVDDLINSFVPSMVKGMDRVGRTLFLFYWHNEDFRDRYGRQDMADLEDSLINVFKSMGDLIIFLRQKTIEADPMLEELDIDLGDASA